MENEADRGLLGGTNFFHKNGSCGKAEQKFHKNPRSKFFFSIADVSTKFQPNRTKDEFVGPQKSRAIGVFTWRLLAKEFTIFFASASNAPERLMGGTSASNFQAIGRKLRSLEGRKEKN
jgi:hypothetical protein